MKCIVYSLLKDFCRNKKTPLIIVLEEKKTLTDVTVDYTAEPSTILMRNELHKLLKEAF